MFETSEGHAQQEEPPLLGPGESAEGKNDVPQDGRVTESQQILGDDTNLPQTVAKAEIQEKVAVEDCDRLPKVKDDATNASGAEAAGDQEQGLRVKDEPSVDGEKEKCNQEETENSSVNAECEIQLNVSMTEEETNQLLALEENRQVAVDEPAAPAHEASTLNHSLEGVTAPVSSHGGSTVLDKSLESSDQSRAAATTVLNQSDEAIKAAVIISQSNEAIKDAAQLSQSIEPIKSATILDQSKEGTDVLNQSEDSFSVLNQSDEDYIVLDDDEAEDDNDKSQAGTKISVQETGQTGHPGEKFQTFIDILNNSLVHLVRLQPAPWSSMIGCTYLTYISLIIW